MRPEALGGGVIPGFSGEVWEMEEELSLLVLSAHRCDPPILNASEPDQHAHPLCFVCSSSRRKECSCSTMSYDPRLPWKML
mmetsp:Transcript_22116/g.50606  ORF Transcript_22116/g.50606 Transcript_22116/m.50606 type:complete len:81 (-) Transcript_22116:94-336(-)